MACGTMTAVGTFLGRFSAGGRQRKMHTKTAETYNYSTVHLVTRNERKIDGKT